MLDWLKKRLVGQRLINPRTIPDALWHHTLSAYPFLAHRSALDQARLRAMTTRFLAQKQFSGAHDLVVTDEMAAAIAAQASLAVLNLGLQLFDDFTGIVVHPGPMLALRSTVDAAGVAHHYREAVVGEAMQGGPVTLSWQDVSRAGELAASGHNVVIHEFAHKIDMRTGAANGCPPLPTRAAKAQWQSVMQAAFEDFKHRVVMAERFGTLSGSDIPWLDAYGATSPAEFFAVTTEAYFVNPTRFGSEFAALKTLFDGYFQGKPCGDQPVGHR